MENNQQKLEKEKKDNKKEKEKDKEKEKEKEKKDKEKLGGQIIDDRLDGKLTISRSNEKKR